MSEPIATKKKRRKLVTSVELARICGVTSTSICIARKNGRIHSVRKKDGAFLFDAEQAKIDYESSRKKLPREWVQIKARQEQYQKELNGRKQERTVRMKAERKAEKPIGVLQPPPAPAMEDINDMELEKPATNDDEFLDLTEEEYNVDSSDCQIRDADGNTVGIDYNLYDKKAHAMRAALAFRKERGELADRNIIMYAMRKITESFKLSLYALPKRMASQVVATVKAYMAQNLPKEFDINAILPDDSATREVVACMKGECDRIMQDFQKSVSDFGDDTLKKSDKRKRGERGMGKATIAKAVK